MQTGILLTNLGTPAQPTTRAVRRYLRQFLRDPKVVSLPQWLWRPILEGIVLPIRAPRSAKLYQTIWTISGSPLLAISRQQQQALQQHLSGQNITVALGMRYGEPSIASALAELRHCEKIMVLPLYPQYSTATTASTFAAVMETLKTWPALPTLKLINQYATHPAYIAALVESLRRQWEQTAPAEHLVFSFHGLPERSIAQGDPYYTLCHETATFIAEKIHYPKERWSVVFQSRFGWQAWLKPYCYTKLSALARAGVKSVDVICPGFATDCLETLEEIAVRAKTLYVQAGGQIFNYIPALNAQQSHIAALAEIVLE
ncbi:MAG: ferrochelatase [Gammaproteobacteria bacterium]